MQTKSVNLVNSRGGGYFDLARMDRPGPRKKLIPLVQKKHFWGCKTSFPPAAPSAPRKRIGGLHPKNRILSAAPSAPRFPHPRCSRPPRDTSVVGLIHLWEYNGEQAQAGQGVDILSPIGILILVIGVVFTVGIPVAMIKFGRKD